MSGYWKCQDFPLLIQQANAKNIFIYTNAAQVPMDSEDEDEERGDIITEEQVTSWVTPALENGMVLSECVISNDIFLYTRYASWDRGLCDSPMNNECWVWNYTYNHEFL